MTTSTVVVIDSGVDPDHPRLRGAVEVVPGPRFDADGPSADKDASVDMLGHGTAVAATIASAAGAVRILSLKVFEREPVCDFRAVIHALRHAMTVDAACVNLSLGTTAVRYRDELTDIIARARASRARIVAPASYGGLPCDPGCLPGVEGVVADPNVPFAVPELRRHAGGWTWFASPLPPRDADGGRALLARGDSLAVAAVSGQLARSATR